MSCTLLPVSEFAKVTPDWDKINQEHYAHPLLESRFTATALEHLGSGEESVITFGPSASPAAIAVISPAKLGAWITFQVPQSPLGACILRPGTDLPDLKKQLFNQLPLSCQILSITQQDPDILPRPATQTTLRTLDYIDTARISVDRDFEDYWGTRGKNLRHNLKRQRNLLEREGVEVRLEVLMQPEEMLDGIRSYGDLESRGWKAERGTAVHMDNEQGRFYADLLKRYAETGNARIYRFYYNEKLSAVDLCIYNESALVILKTTYDETVKTSSPALLMRREYFPAIFDNREVRRIEFYGRVMDWHTKWSDEIRTMYHINAYRSAMIAKLHDRS